MKKYWYIILLFLCLSGGLFSSCSDEMDEKKMEGSDKITLHVQFDTRAGDTDVTTDPQKLNNSEYRIRSIRLYAFDGEILDNMVYESELNNVTGKATVKIEVKPGNNKTFYAIVNEPNKDEIHSALALANHPNGIKQVQYSMADYLNSEVNALTEPDDYYLPMYQELTNVNIAKTSSSLNIGVDRAVARIDLYIIKANGINAKATTENASLKVERSNKNGFIATENVISTNTTAFFEMDQPQPVTLKEYSTNYADYTKVYSFYVPEQTCEDEAHRLKFTLGGILWDGRKMDAPYNTFYLGNDGANTDGQILTKISRNKVYQIYCRIKPMIKEVSFDVVTLPWNVVETQVEETEKGEINMVNCYMVTPGGSVNIPVANVYRFWAWSDDLLESDIVPISKEMEVHPEVIWSDTEDLITSVGLITSPGTDKKDHARIRVRTASGKEGNAVIGMRMKDSAGNLETGYRWSWHVWVTDYNPEIVNDVFNGHTIMDRNLGAKINYYDENGYVKGLVYQWGRKDPFPGSKGWGNDEIDLYGMVTRISLEEISEEMNLVNSIHKPQVFYFAPNLPCDWYTTEKKYMNNELWLTTEGKKSIYDPCPEGWRVSLTTVGWETLTESNFPIENKGRKGNGISLGYYPGGNQRDYFDGANYGILNRSWVSDYWFADPDDEGNITCFTVDSKMKPQYVNDRARAFGNAVRCVKE